MFTLSRTTTLLAICALAAFLLAPAAASAQGAPGEEQYKFEPPTAGSGGAPGEGSQGGTDEGSGGVPAAAADSADDGGLPILLVVLAGTALAGAAIAIIRRQKT
jgi:hypothetical protein